MCVFLDAVGLLERSLFAFFIVRPPIYRLIPFFVAGVQPGEGDGGSLREGEAGREREREREGERE